MARRRCPCSLAFSTQTAKKDGPRFRFPSSRGKRRKVFVFLDDGQQRPRAHGVTEPGVTPDGTTCMLALALLVCASAASPREAVPPGVAPGFVAPCAAPLHSRAWGRARHYRARGRRAPLATACAGAADAAGGNVRGGGAGAPRLACLPLPFLAPLLSPHATPSLFFLARARWGRCRACWTLRGASCAA